MSNSTRDRIAAAFDRELAESPVPPSLRTLAIREAVAAPRQRSNQPQLLALIAAILVVAVVATLVIGSHLLQSKPIPAGSTVPPPPRANASAAYDQAHGALVVFGGNTGPNPPVSETWTWDGKYWTHSHPAVSPSARYGAAMAYDSARHDIVLFGGTGLVKGKVGTTAAAETWAWDGSNWHEKHPLHAPAIGYEWQGPSMQFDPITRTVLLFGFTDPARATSRRRGRGTVRTGPSSRPPQRPLPPARCWSPDGRSCSWPDHPAWSVVDT